MLSFFHAFASVLTYDFLNITNNFFLFLFFPQTYLEFYSLVGFIRKPCPNQFIFARHFCLSLTYFIQHFVITHCLSVVELLYSSLCLHFEDFQFAVFYSFVEPTFILHTTHFINHFLNSLLIGLVKRFLVNVSSIFAILAFITFFYISYSSLDTSQILVQLILFQFSLTSIVPINISIESLHVNSTYLINLTISYFYDYWFIENTIPIR